MSVLLIGQALDDRTPAEGTTAEAGSAVEEGRKGDAVRSPPVAGWHSHAVLLDASTRAVDRVMGLQAPTPVAVAPACVLSVEIGAVHPRISEWPKILRPIEVVKLDPPEWEGRGIEERHPQPEVRLIGQFDGSQIGAVGHSGLQDLCDRGGVATIPAGVPDFVCEVCSRCGRLQSVLVTLHRCIVRTHPGRSLSDRCMPVRQWPYTGAGGESSECLPGVCALGRRVRRPGPGSLPDEIRWRRGNAAALPVAVLGPPRGQSEGSCQWRVVHLDATVKACALPAC